MDKKTECLTLYFKLSCELSFYSSCVQSGEERLKKIRQMELQMPGLSYVVVPHFLLFCM